MVKLKNENGTYNVYDFTEGDGKWLEVDAGWLENVDLRGVAEIELWWGKGNLKELKVIFFNGSCIWYQDIHGSWGFPYRVV